MTLKGADANWFLLLLNLSTSITSTSSRIQALIWITYIAPQTAPTSCLAPSGLFSHESQREPFEAWRQSGYPCSLLYHRPEVKAQNPSRALQDLTRPGPCLTLQLRPLSPFPSLLHCVSFSSCPFCWGWFSVPSSPRLPVHQIKHHFPSITLLSLNLGHHLHSPQNFHLYNRSLTFSCVYLPDWTESSRTAKAVSAFTHHCVPSIYYSPGHLVDNYQLFVEWIKARPHPTLLGLHNSHRIRSSNEFTDKNHQTYWKANYYKSQQRPNGRYRPPTHTQCCHQGQQILAFFSYRI